MSNIYKSSSHVVFSCKYHVILTTKYRTKILRPYMEKYFKKLCYEIASDHSFQILEMECMPNHVHLLLEISPHQEITNIIKLLKGRTSRKLRESNPWLTKFPSFWTRSAFVSSVGAVSLKVVKRYIQHQKIA